MTPSRWHGDRRGLAMLHLTWGSFDFSFFFWGGVSAEPFLPRRGCPFLHYYYFARGKLRVSLQGESHHSGECPEVGFERREAPAAAELRSHQRFEPVLGGRREDGEGNEGPMETIPPPPRASHCSPAGLPWLQLCTVQPCSAREGFRVGNVSPDCSGGKCDLWLQCRLRSWSSRSFPPPYKTSLPHPEEARCRSAPHHRLIWHGRRRCGDIFVTAPLPALSLRGSSPPPHPKPSSGVCKVTSANHPGLRPPGAARVGSGLFHPVRRVRYARASREHRPVLQPRGGGGRDLPLPLAAGTEPSSPTSWVGA